MKNIIKKIQSLISNNPEHNHEFEYIYDRYSTHTMIPKRSYIRNLRLIANYKHSNGDVVECGVWRGGMIAGMAEVLGNTRTYHLFDSFEGLPPAKEIDGRSAIEWQKNKDGIYYFDNCTAKESYATQLFQKLNVKYTINKGWFEQTLPNYNYLNHIDILRLDADWYESTLICLQYLYPKVRKGGIIIIDDYYAWDGCSKAVHDYLSAIKSNDKIESQDNFAYIIKKS
jgi:hypothetical protein